MIRLSPEASKQLDSIRADIDRVKRVFGSATPHETISEAEGLLAGLEHKVRSLRMQMKRERVNGSAEELRRVA